MSNTVELLTVQTALAARQPAPADTRGWPRQAGAIACRKLPWPFGAYASIASDCDGGVSTFDVIDDAFGHLREELGLPVGDSYFADIVCSGPISYGSGIKIEDIPAVVAEPAHEEFVARAGKYVRKAHLGWFDTVHGFLMALVVKIPSADGEADEISNDPRPSFRQRMRTLAVARDGYRQKERFRFHFPDGWPPSFPPRYVLLRYSSPVAVTTLQIDIFVGDKLVHRVHGATATFGTPLNALNWYMIDLWRSVGMFHVDLQKVEVEINVNGPPGAYAEIHDVIQTSHVIGDIERFARILDRYNMTASVFTSHGGGIVLAPTYAKDNLGADPRRLADVPENPIYSAPLLRDFGIRFMTTYSNTSSTRVVPIEGLVFVNSLNDGKPVYDFYRYFYQPKSLDRAALKDFWMRSGRQLSPSLVDTLGIHIDGFFEEIAGKPNHGGLIYTHLYTTNAPVAGEDASWFERPFNDQTRAGLATLSERYFNPAGRIAPSERIMVAPLPTLLRLSIMQQQIEGHAYYDEAENAIHVAPWFDPVLRETTPSAANGFRELRALTFYVKDSHDARLFVGGGPCDDLIRNPPDETGRPSITVADGSAPFVLLGRVPLSQTRASVAKTGIKLQEPARGGGSHKLTLTTAQASLRVAPRLASASNYQALRLAFTKSNAKMRIGLRLRFRSGLEILLGEKGLATAEPFFIFEPWNSTETRVLVVPFYMLIETAARRAAGGKLGLGGILDWEVIVSGKARQELTLASFRLLRDCDRPGTDGGVIVGGQCEASLGITAARMIYEGREYETKIAPGGIFIFSRKVERGSVVEIFGVDQAGAEFSPSNGRFVEILTDKTDVDFNRDS